MVITMAKLRMAHASTHGARKPPGPKILQGLRVVQAAVTERRKKLHMAHASTHGARKPPGPKNNSFCIYLLVMPKYWEEQILAHRRFPEVGKKQKTEEREKRKKERKTERW